MKLRQYAKKQAISYSTALTSNRCGFMPLLVNGRPLKAWNQDYNKRRAALQAKLAKTNRFTSRQLEQFTDKRNQRIKHYLHVASRTIIDQLVQYRISILICQRQLEHCQKSIPDSL